MEKEVSEVITGKGEGIGFKIKWLGINLNLKIRLLTATQVVKIAGLVGATKDVDENKAMFTAFVEGVSDIKMYAKAIAIATGSPFQWIVYRAVMGLTLEDISTLWQIVQKQCDASRFFFIIVLTKGRMDLLKPRAESEGE